MTAQPEIYGTATLDDLVGDARARPQAHGYELEHFQSNHEGALIDAIQARVAGARRSSSTPARSGTTRTRSPTRSRRSRGRRWSCTSRTRLAREAWRHRSVIAPYVTGTIQGFGRAGYHLAVDRRRSASSRRCRDDRHPRRPPRDGRRRRAPAVSVTQFADAGIDALLVTHLPNVRYLTSFTGSAGMVLVTRDALVFTTDGRYRTQAAEQLGGAGVDARRSRSAPPSPRSARPSHVRSSPARASVSRRTRSRGRSSRTSPRRCDGHELVATDGLVEQLRRVKEPGEVARIRAACAIADDALGALLPHARRRPHRTRLRARARSRDAPTRRERQQLRPDHRVGSQRGQAARAPDRAARSNAASSSSSTSGASSTATAPT